MTASSNPDANPHANRPPNRLSRESSPYLLQHAHNPVDWRPWGPDAIAEARQRDVPIFLSIGYSTCYWCHVMERESFENDDIARVMNEHCVNIKLDREERPDLDDIYMAATMLTTGSGGWPMSVFLEPDTLRPFYCGTYFPATSNHGRPAFPDLVAAISEAYHQQRDQLRTHAHDIAQAVREHLAARATSSAAVATLGARHVAEALQQVLAAQDPAQGGFGKAPKFPQPVFLDFLLDGSLRAADDSTRDAIEFALRRALNAMALGGIFDQIAGGFHRYSVDAHWTVPHFEKMLYDNAQLASVYAAASRTLAEPFFDSIARRTLDFVLREMTNAKGGFHSAIDAEVDGQEGLNYLWTRAQLIDALGTDDGAFASEMYQVDAGPNFQDPHHPDAPPSNVLRLARRVEESAKLVGRDPQAVQDRLDAINAKLLAARATRKQPRIDDKAIASWNGLMIGAFARAGRELDEPRYIAAASRAAEFARANLLDASGGLRRSWREGVHGPRAVLEDHAALAHGLLELARADRNHPFARDLALTLLSRIRAEFVDADSGVPYDTRDAETDLFVRPRSTHDGAIPSATSLYLHALLDAHELTSDDTHLQHAIATLATLVDAIGASPMGCVNSTRALLRVLAKPELAAMFTGNDSQSATQSTDSTPNTNPLDHDPVQIFAEVERLTITESEPAVTNILVKIENGYHVAAAEPGFESITPFRVRITGGTGVVAYADYPQGHWYPPDAHSAQAQDSLGRMRAYTGAIELRIVLERQGTWSGRPLIAVTYQPCRDDACLHARTVELDIALDPA
jgi:uncharacterized protein YyaL (SSP411 family)